LPMDVSAVPQERPLVLAIRAESGEIAQPGEQAVFDALIESIYTMGKEALAYLKVGTQEMRIYIDPDEGHTAGETIGVALKQRGVFLFDRETEARLL